MSEENKKQEHEETRTQEHKDTSAQEPRDTSTQEHKDTSTQEPKDTGAQDHKDTSTQENKDQTNNEKQITNNCNGAACLHHNGSKEETNEKQNTDGEKQTNNTEDKQIPLKDLKFIKADTTDYSKRIIVVTGHDQKMNKAILSALKGWKFETVLTQGKQNASKLLIEKAKDNEKVSIAVVILSADDYVYDKNSKPGDAVTKADQKVVFELGFWIGKFGRNRVFAIYYDQKSFRVPTEFFDVSYIPFYYKSDSWRNKLLERITDASNSQEVITD